MAIDPGRLWKGPWRWFSEEQLDCCIPLEHVQANGITLDELACLARCNGATARVYRADEIHERGFQEAIESSSQSAGGRVLIASYSRAALGQTGEGHFSPLAGYHRGRDLALILDVARFKYSSHWVTVGSLFSAMRTRDSATGRSRGFIELERGSSPRNLGFVFTTAYGLPLEGSTVTRAFQRILDDAALPRMRFHDLRHACASFMLAHGAPMRVVMEQLGHSQISLTMNTYTHVMDAALRDASTQMEAFLTAGTDA